MAKEFTWSPPRASFMESGSADLASPRPNQDGDDRDSHGRASYSPHGRWKLLTCFNLVKVETMPRLMDNARQEEFMKIKISFAALLFLSLCSAVSIRDTSAFAKAASFEGGGLPTPCPPGYPTPTCGLRIQK